MASPDTHPQHYLASTTPAYQLIEPITIDDDDLMFGGKSLSAWYEEERRRARRNSEEERRGRQRVSSPTFSFVLPFFVAGVQRWARCLGIGANDYTVSDVPLVAPEQDPGLEEINWDKFYDTTPNSLTDSTSSQPPNATSAFTSIATST